MQSKPASARPIIVKHAQCDTVTNVPVDIWCYGSDDDFICRIDRLGEQPRSPSGDAWYPYPPLGFLWFRGATVSGMLKRSFFPDQNSINRLLEFVMQGLPAADYQTTEFIDLVDVQYEKIESGEESLFFKVTADDEAFFSSGSAAGSGIKKTDP